MNTTLFPKADPTFWTRLSQIMMLFTGALSAYYSGTQAVKASIGTETFTAHSYANYSGGSLLAKFTGLFESIFSILFLAMSADMIGGPLFLAYKMDSKNTDSLKNLFLACIASMGSFFGGQSLSYGVDNVIGFFNTYDSAPFGTDFVSQAANTVAYLFDVILHMIESLMYLGLAYLLSNGAFHLVYTILDE